MNEIRQRFPRIREKSRGTLTAFFGDAAGLADELERDEPKQRIRTYSETYSDEVAGAIRLLGRVRGSVTIINGPAGCGGVKLEDELRAGGSPWLITNIEENDSILGADDKLKEAIGRAHRLWKPEILFILATPVVAINNDDIQSAAVEAEERLGIPVIPVYAAGFRSRTALYGHDLVYHALAKYVLGRSGAAEPKERRVNLTGGSGTKSGYLLKDLAEAGISYNNVNSYFSLDDLKRSLNALASIPVDRDSSRYLLEYLEDSHGVPQLDVPAPIGLSGTERWLIAAAEAAGSGEQARAYAGRQRAAAEEALNEHRLDGVSVFVDLPPSQAFGVGERVRELGGEVAGFGLTHADRGHAAVLREWSRRKNPRVLVHSGQPFEKLNALLKWRPDLYVGPGESAVWAAKAGIPAAASDSVDLYGFRGAAALAGLFAKALRNPAFSRYLGAGDSSYREGWLSKSVNWHIKQEVR